MADSRHPAARRAEFVDVTPERPRKKPRWLSPRESSIPPPAPSQPTASQPRAAEPPSLKPAPVPKEFVQAVRRELRTLPTAAPSASHEIARGLAESEALAQQMARSLRPSELPPGLVPPVVEARPDPGMERAFRAAIEEMATTRTKVLEAAARELATLAAIIARRVIARELLLAPEILENLVHEALEALSEQDRIRVRVGRGFQHAVDGLEQKLGIRGNDFRVIIEEGLGDYDCVVETELGQVDESVEKRLERLLEALKPDSEAP